MTERNTKDEKNEKYPLTKRQRTCIILRHRWKRWCMAWGSIAQLGEHLPYKQRVTGSSPVVPTNVAR